MSTTQKQIQQYAFDPIGLGAYQSMIPGLQQYISRLLTSNPLQSPYYNMVLSANLGAANQLGQTLQSNFARNLVAGGGGAAIFDPFKQSMQAQIGRQQAGLRAGAFGQSLGTMLGLQQSAAGMASGFRPLQTGGTQTTTLSGLGTWLPQVAGMGLGLATGGLGGGAMGGFGSLFPRGSHGFGSPITQQAFPEGYLG